jgi:hypothetical protein
MAEDGYAKHVLVTTEWLADHLGDDDLVVAEVDEDPALYDDGHIPGAVKLHWREDLQDPVERDLVEKNEFEELLGSRGSRTTRASSSTATRTTGLPHRRAERSHVVRAPRAPGLRECPQLRRLVDRVGQSSRRPDRNRFVGL